MSQATPDGARLVAQEQRAMYINRTAASPKDENRPCQLPSVRCIHVAVQIMWHRMLLVHRKVEACKKVTSIHGVVCGQ